MQINWIRPLVSAPVPLSGTCRERPAGGAVHRGPGRCPRLPFDRFSEPAGRSPFPLWATQYRAILLASLSVSRTRWGFRSPPATPRRSFLTLRKCFLDKKPAFRLRRKLGIQDSNLAAAILRRI